MRRGAFTIPSLAVAGCSALPQREPADLVLRGGKVLTVDSARPEAEAISVRGSRIVAVGSDEEVERFVGASTQVVELDGRVAMPGFIEGHGHYLGLGEMRLNLDLRGARSWEEIVTMVGESSRQAEPGAWIVGRGWHQEKWDRLPEPNVDGVPLHASLDDASPDNPVILEHASSHATFANRRALAVAGIDRATPDPEGGEIVKDGGGAPTGLLRETAAELVHRAIERSRQGRTEQEREAELRRTVRLAGEEALSKGVTSFHDAGVDFATVDLYRKLEAEGALPVRLYVMVSAPLPELREKLAHYRMPAATSDFLVVRSIKRRLDGALGSHGAWLLEPYADLPSTTGFATDDTTELQSVAQLALEHGCQLSVHAIGDRANREVLDIYERALAAHPQASAVRWRIEHAQHLHPDDVRRFAARGVIASMQGVHATSDGPWVARRLGAERARSGAYVWRDLLEAGVRIANGTDTPVEDIDPLASYYSSVTRMMDSGEAFHPEQRMTREEALRSYTIDNAFAAFEEEEKGSLAPGKLADIVVLSQNILTVPDAALRETRVEMTILGGEVRYRR